MRTETNAGSTSTGDFDWVKVALLVANTRYRIVWDVACLHEGIIFGIFSRAVSGQSASFMEQVSISRETDGWCTDLTIEFTAVSAPFGPDYFISLTARGSDFPKNGPSNPSRYAFQGVWGTLTVERIS